MKGVIFNLFEDFVVETWSEDVYEEILSNSSQREQEPCVGPVSYPDSDLTNLVESASKILHMSPYEVLSAFGRYSFPKLAVRVQHIMTEHQHPRSFLAVVDSIVHYEVRSMFAESQHPRFRITDLDDERIYLDYDSPRRLCGMIAGILDGTRDYFGFPLTYSHSECVSRGGSLCRFLVDFGPEKENKTSEIINSAPGDLP